MDDNQPDSELEKWLQYEPDMFIYVFTADIRSFPSIAEDIAKLVSSDPRAASFEISGGETLSSMMNMLTDFG